MWRPCDPPKTPYYNVLMFEMRRRLLLLGSAVVAVVSVSTAQTPAAQSYDRAFAGNTMRVDSVHPGGPGGEVLSLDRVVSDGPWPGSRTRLLDDANLGRYFFEVIDG